MDFRRLPFRSKEVQKCVVSVIRDIVCRYDVDALHFDDYFYPYRIPGKEFPDDASYAKYGNGMSRDDWRRSNVDSIILQLSTMIKEEKKYCKFGISPFCVWRNISKDPEGSETQAGQTNYDDLYADILLWLNTGERGAVDEIAVMAGVTGATNGASAASARQPMRTTWPAAMSTSSSVKSSSVSGNSIPSVVSSA